MYNGLTTADKGALLDAKARGAKWAARDKDDELVGFRLKPQKYVDMELNSDHWERTESENYFIAMPNDDPLQFIQWSDAEPVNIDLALAQIAEMESAEKPKGCSFCCYTEYPDATLYPRDRSEFYAGRSRQVRVDDFDEDELNEVSYCPNCGRNLNSPYTEGATK